MKSIGELISSDAPPPRREFVDDEPKVHRVTLCAMAFAEIEVIAKNAAEARILAEGKAGAARPTFTTAPLAMRVRVRGPKDTKGEPTWIEVGLPPSL